MHGQNADAVNQVAKPSDTPFLKNQYTVDKGHLESFSMNQPISGRTLSRAVHIDDEVTARTVKASVAFRRLPELSENEMESVLTPS